MSLLTATPDTTGGEDANGRRMLPLHPVSVASLYGDLLALLAEAGHWVHVDAPDALHAIVSATMAHVARGLCVPKYSSP